MDLVPEIHEEPPKNERFEALVVGIDESRAALLETCTRYVKMPNARNRKMLYESSDASASSIGTFVLFMLEDEISDDDEKASIIATTIDRNTESRVAHFNQLFSNSGEPFVASSKTRKVIKEIITPSEETEDEQSSMEKLQDILIVYSENFFEDLDGFFELTDQTTIGKAFDLSRFIGKQGLDLLKIGVGTVAGAAIYKEWERRRAR